MIERERKRHRDESDWLVSKKEGEKKSHSLKQPTHKVCVCYCCYTFSLFFCFENELDMTDTLSHSLLLYLGYALADRQYTEG